MGQHELGALRMRQEMHAHQRRLARHDADAPGVDQLLRRPDALEAAGDPGDRAVGLKVGEPIVAALAQVDVRLGAGHRPGPPPLLQQLRLGPGRENFFARRADDAA